MTTLATPAGYSAADLVFSDNFSGSKLNSAAWNTYVTSAAANGYPWNAGPNGGSGVGAQNDAEYFMPSQVAVNDGLTLTALKQSINGVPSTVPETSGAVSSYGKFQFTGGLLQISMKAPAGAGSWPGLWLMPGKGATGGDSFEIDMQEGGYTKGSTNPNNTFSWHLHTPNGTFGGTIDAGVDLTKDFHTYAIDWQPGKSITWYLDGKQMAQLTSAQAPIPTQPMQVIMDEQVANSNTSGWHTTFNGSTTPQSMPMQIAGVQLYQKAGSGQTVMGGNVTKPIVVTDPTGPTTTPPTTTPTTPPTTTSPTPTTTWTHHHHHRSTLASTSTATTASTTQKTATAFTAPTASTVAAGAPQADATTANVQAPVAAAPVPAAPIGSATQPHTLVSSASTGLANAATAQAASAHPAAPAVQAIALLQQYMASGFDAGAGAAPIASQLASINNQHAAFLASPR